MFSVILRNDYKMQSSHGPACCSVVWYQSYSAVHSLIKHISFI